MIRFPKDQPIKPPIVDFDKPIPFHPNVFANGMICIDILKEKWCSGITLNKLVLTLFSLLTDPCVEDPANLEVAKVYLQDKTLKTYKKAILEKIGK